MLSEPGEIGFPEDGIRIEATQGEYDSSGNEYHPPMTSVWLDERLVFDTHTAHPEMIPPAYAGQRVYYVDLTGDGRRDLLIYTSYGGNGLGALLEQADLLIRRDAGFQHVTLEVYAPTPLEQFR